MKRMKKTIVLCMAMMMLFSISAVVSATNSEQGNEKPVGSLENPQKIESLGEVKVELEAGDEDGYYYTWTATKDDVLNFEMTDAPVEVDYDIILTNGEKVVSLTKDGVISGGIKTVSVNVKVGDVVGIQLITLADKTTGEYPAATLTAFSDLGVRKTNDNTGNTENSGSTENTETNSGNVDTTEKEDTTTDNKLSPATGDKGYMITLIIMVAALATVVVVLVRKKKQM